MMAFDGVEPAHEVDDVEEVLEATPEVDEPEGHRLADRGF